MPEWKVSAGNDKYAVGINSQLEIGRYPRWLNGGNVGANDLSIGIFIGKVTAEMSVYKSCSAAAVGINSHIAHIPVGRRRGKVSFRK